MLLRRANATLARSQSPLFSLFTLTLFGHFPKPRHSPLGALYVTASQKPAVATSTATRTAPSTVAAAVMAPLVAEAACITTTTAAASVLEPVCCEVTTLYLDLDAIHAQLLAIELADPAAAPRRNEVGEPLWDPVVVFESISREDFCVWLDLNEGKLRRWWYEPITEDTGRVLVYSLPSFPHEFAVSEISSAVNRQLNRIGGVEMEDTIIKPSSPRYEVEDRSQEPDATFSPRETCMQQTFPNVVVEVEYENLTEKQMKEKLLRWMQQRKIRVAIGIKLNATRLDHVAICYLHGLEEAVRVEFGSDIANPSPLTFPISELYFGASIPEELAGQDEITIDLIAFRERVNVMILRHQDEKMARRLKASLPYVLMDEKPLSGSADVHVHEDLKRSKRRAKATALLHEPVTKKHCGFHVKDPRTELAKIQVATVADAPAQDEEGEPSWGPVVVFDSISRAAFREWLSSDQGWLRRWWYEPLALDQDSGRVAVYSLADAVINATASRVITNIIAEVRHIGDRHASKTLQIEAEPTCHLSDRDQQPLTSLTPKQLHSTHHFPNLVVEVESRNVSLTMLKQKLLRWMGLETTVQVAIGIKLNESSKTHVAMRYSRGGGEEPQIVRFGEDVEDPSPLTFPLQALYYGATVPASLAGHKDDIIAVDLDE